MSQSDVSGIDIRLPPNVCGEWQIRGRIVGPNAEPLAGISVSAYQTGGGGQRHSSASAADGSFAVTLNESGEYRISADLGHGCSVYYRSGAPTTNSNSASPVTVTDVPVGGVLIQVPEDLCRLRVGGFLDGIERFLDGYVSANLCRMTDDGCSSSASRQLDDDGTFAVATPTSGAYRLTYNLEGCTVYFGSGGLTTTYSERSTVRIEGRSVQTNPRQIPAGVCAYQITGSIIQANGQPLADSRVSACLEVNGGCAIWLGDNTDDDGAFAITVPVDGVYRLSFNLEGCTIYFRRGGLTTNANEQGTATISRRNVRLNPRQVPTDMCAHRILGRFVDSSGTPLSEKWINAFRAGHGSGVWTDPDGRFEIRVPSDGAYTFGVQLRSQPYCWHNLAEPALGSRNNPVRVSGADVTGIELRLPGTIEELCE